MGVWVDCAEWSRHCSKKKKNPKQIINPKREKKIPNINQALFTKRGDAETQTQGTRWIGKGKGSYKGEKITIIMKKNINH